MALDTPPPRWSRGHSVVGRAWASLEKWEAPYSKPQRTKAGRQGLGRGRGARELPPALCWPRREVHSTQTPST